MAVRSRRLVHKALRDHRPCSRPLPRRGNHLNRGCDRLHYCSTAYLDRLPSFRSTPLQFLPSGLVWPTQLRPAVLRGKLRTASAFQKSGVCLTFLNGPATHQISYWNASGLLAWQKPNAYERLATRPTFRDSANALRGRVGTASAFTLPLDLTLLYPPPTLMPHILLLATLDLLAKHGSEDNPARKAAK
jgi:hypothetical protein